jgi:nucleoid DNA-binding protein
LKPKKVKDLIPKISKELQLSEEEVKSVLDVYWDKVRKSLSSLEYEYVNVPGLGVFGVKPWMVEKKLRINNHLIEKYINTPTVGSLTIINNLSKDNIKLNSTKEKLEVLKQKKEKIKHERRNQNLEGEEQDS